MTQLIDKMKVEASTFRGKDIALFMVSFGDSSDEISHVSVTDEGEEALIETCGAVVERTFRYIRITRLDPASGEVETIFEATHNLAAS